MVEFFMFICLISVAGFVLFFLPWYLFVSFVHYRLAEHFRLRNRTKQGGDSRRSR